MNSAPHGQACAAGERAFARLPAWLRPRESELRGRGQLRLVETTLLVLAALVLATATIYDLTREARINHRLNADIATWQRYTGHHYRELSIDTTSLGYTGERDIVCGNTSPGEPGQRTQICLVIEGRTHEGLRTIHAGWYLPPHTPDTQSKRYRCFGASMPGVCGS